MKTQQDKDNFIEAYKNSLANVSIACAKVNICRFTYYDWLKKDEDFKKRVEEVNESMLDYAESKLLQEIKNDNVTALIFFLKTKGKNRGYTERNEVTGADGKDLVPTTFVFGNDEFVETYGNKED